MNATRSKTKGAIVDITDADSFEKKLPYFLVGLIGTVAGTVTFYVLPLSIITFNLGLLLEIFFLILVGMIFGLTLISFNLQRLMETIIVYTLLILER